MEELLMDNILSTEEIDNLFSNEENEQETPEKETPETEKNTEETTEELNVDTLFTDIPESVGSGKEDINEGKEDTNSTKEIGASPKNNFYSSIARALRDEGIFPDLDNNVIDSIKQPEDFAEMVEQTIQSKFDERQKRIDDALNYGVEISDIQRYENTLKYLNSIKDDTLSAETEQGENLRKQLIYQDYINRGFSKERAEREVNRSLDLGKDVEDAKEALASNKEFFNNEYNSLVENAKKEEQQVIQERKEQAEKLRKSILEDSKVFGDLQLDKSTRQKVFDSISKPIYKDPDTGELFTAIQKYEKENRMDFLKNIGLLFTLTDGFKSLDKLVKGKVKKEVNKGLRELENMITNTSRTTDGNLRYVSGVNDDPDSVIPRGWDLDV